MANTIKVYNFDVDAIKVGSQDVSAVYVGSEKVYPSSAHDYSQDYLTFVAKTSGTFRFSGNTSFYSTNGGSTWTSLGSNVATPTITSGSKILWKATITPSSSRGIGRFRSTAKFEVEGNPMSMLYGDNFRNQTSLSGKSYAHRAMFSGCTGMTSAENLVLPATTLASSCYYCMFKGCTNLTTAPKMLATTLASSCYYQMFYGCTSLTTAPQLPATTLANSCYQYMFQGCTSLSTAPELLATTLANYCYAYMFYGCKNLTTAPQLPATTLAQFCYYGMFYECTALAKAPELSVTTLASGCYFQMFYYCTSLITAPELPATTLADNCYYSMFYGCTSLTTAPELSATTLAQSCYQQMFYNCSQLNYIVCLATDITASNCTYNWVHNVASSGTFVKSEKTSWTRGDNGIPTNWSVESRGYSQEYLTFVAREDGTFKLSGNSVNYSLDSGSTWTTLASNTNSPTVTSGSKILWKATLTPTSSIGIGKFYSSAQFDVEGNPMSLLYGDNFRNQTSLSGKSYAFWGLFSGNTNVVSAENLVLPATTLASNCYRAMFYGCRSLTSIPQELPATTLVDSCYRAMFGECVLLTSVDDKYLSKATTMVQACYMNMFIGCSSLVKAPSLVASTLATQCYQGLFNRCTSLNYIKCLATNISASNCTSSWVTGVASSGTFVKAASMTSWTRGTSGIPNNWTVQDAATCEYNFCGVDGNGNDVTIDNGTTTLSRANFSSPYPVEGMVGAATTTIGSYCFQNVSSTITALTIGDTVSIIEHEAFMETSLLTTLTIPSSVTQIDFWAFTRCYGLTEVIFEGTTPPTFTNVNSGVFHDYCPSVIYVPDTAVEAYRAISGSVWTNETWTSSIIQPISNRP